MKTQTNNPNKVSLSKRQNVQNILKTNQGATLADMFLHHHEHTPKFILTQSHISCPAAKYSLEHNMWIYPLLKVVPNKCLLSVMFASKI